MDFGIVLQPDPPAWKTVELARQAELEGFSYAWTFDSHLLWLETNVIYSQILANTHRMKVGPMVTNPITRHPSVTASTFATLNTMFGNRTIIGIGRGDSAVRVLNGKPSTLGQLREATTMIKGLVNGQTIETAGETIQLPWAADSRTDVLIAAYGPKVLQLAGACSDGLIMQLADPEIIEWAIRQVRTGAEGAGRDPQAIKIVAAAPAYVGDDLEHQREQCRWFGGMVGNHAADVVARYGKDGDIPAIFTHFIDDRTGYDYNEHGRAGNSHVDFVTDEIVERFCVLGPVENHVKRLNELAALGVDQFALYLQHDGKEQTMSEYGRHVIPQVNVAGKVRV